MVRIVVATDDVVEMLETDGDICVEVMVLDSLLNCRDADSDELAEIVVWSADDEPDVVVTTVNVTIDELGIEVDSTVEVVEDESAALAEDAAVVADSTIETPIDEDDIPRLELDSAEEAMVEIAEVVADSTVETAVEVAEVEEAFSS